ncbi:MAG TPA: P1 family peptidase [Albidovulum sp.]|uniref:DmpA family aminopeptidase n=1 Tax=Albidovulum sp. TaxID=1872424 RepID=UPI002BAA3851|nr:P1 family peptidase [Albidovulum sp.]
MAKMRARDLGLDVPGLPGPLNAITDVPGVEVGQTTIISGDGPLQSPKGPVRTGVTAILPRGHDNELSPVWAGIYALNGNGEMTGSHWIKDGGYFHGPVLITNTQSVGMAHHAATGWMIDHYPQIREDHFWCMPVVAETYDGCLNDINGRHVKEEHVLAAIDSAKGGPVAEGAVGGGTGMIAYEYKGGTGTASRKIGDHTVGVLVQANHGIRDWLTVFGTRVGHLMRDDLLFDQERGSIIVVVATDAPMMPHQLQRLARRAAIGIGRNGTPGGNNSGDIFLAFSTANRRSRASMETGVLSFDWLSDNDFDPYYLAAVEATEEAVINAMLAAEDFETLKPAGKVCRAMRPEALLAAIAQAKGGA